MTELNYMDRFGRWHDKPIKEGKEWSSNNGWFYTAVSKRVGMVVHVIPGAAYFCARHLSRHPYVVRIDDSIPPISRDEILGLVYLGHLTKKNMKGWNFSPYILPRFNIFKFIAQLWECRGKHRNHFWKNELSQVYHVAFVVPLQDRHFILTCWGEFNAFYWLIDKINNKIKITNRSSRLIRFLKTGKDIEAVANYFGPNHPITKHSQGTI